MSSFSGFLSHFSCKVSGAGGIVRSGSNIVRQDPHLPGTGGEVTPHRDFSTMRGPEQSSGQADNLKQTVK